MVVKKEIGVELIRRSPCWRYSGVRGDTTGHFICHGRTCDYLAFSELGFETVAKAEVPELAEKEEHAMDGLAFFLGGH